jgi:MFS family permease
MKRGDSKNVILAGTASLFNDIGSEMIAAILPFYVIALGGGGIAVGILSGLREGVGDLFNVIGGWVSDRIGKRKFLVFLGYLISAIFRFLLGTANSYQQVLVLVGSERVGKMRDAPRDAIISKSSKKRGKSFGIQQMMDTSGAVLGTILALFFFWKLNLGFQYIILIASVIAIVSIIPILFLRDYKSRKIKKNLFAGAKSLNGSLKYFFFVTGFFTLGNFGLYTFLLLRAKEISGSIIIPLALYVLFNFVYAVMTIPFGKLSDKIGRKKVLLSGYVLFLLVCFGLIFISNIVYLGILFALYGLVYAITYSNQRALVGDLSGKMRGTAFGIYYFIIGFASIVGGIIAGALWNINYSIMFAFVSIIAFISIILLIFVKEKLTEKKFK